MKFTPGPWKVIDGWDKDGIGDYFPFVLFRPGIGILINDSHDKQKETIMRNAYLMAAAPELLKACETALSVIQLGSICIEEYRNIKRILDDAISKANGEY